MALGELPTYPHRIIIPFPGPLWVWIPPMSTYTRVLCYLWNYHGDTLKMYSALRLEGLNAITLTLVQTKAFKQHLARWNISCSILLKPLRRQHDLTTRLGAVAFPVL